MVFWFCYFGENIFKVYGICFGSLNLWFCWYFKCFYEYLLGRIIYKLEFLVKDVMKVFYNVYFVIEDVVIL